MAARWHAALTLTVILSGCASAKTDASNENASAGMAGAGGVSNRSALGGATSSRTDPTGGASTSSASSGTVATLSERYPNDASLATDSAVLFHDDFEQGWGKWDAPSRDTANLFLETGTAFAHSGTRYLRSTVTEAQLQAQEYISASTKLTFGKRVDTVYWRFYARFQGISPTPHHWVRMAAGTEAYSSSGLANTVPPGDQGFWFDFDANTDDVFNFYVYWYKMRSGRCNDGSTTPGCAGDQGTTYFYGNNFRPPNQRPFPRDTWFCVEIMAKANRVGSSDGALAFSINGRTVGDYRPGYPDGTWLRDSFHTDGCSFSACTEPSPFEGFDFRSSPDVQFKGLFLDAYYERNTTANKRAELEAKGLTVSNEQTIYYDDVVVATEPIGCGKFD
ncbi:MAG: hypothetical protein QM784_39260 [Polyangiaceae bacterium]